MYICVYKKEKSSACVSTKKSMCVCEYVHKEISVR